MSWPRSRPSYGTRLVKGHVKLPGGAAFRGSTLTPKRRVDYKTLEHQFPEAYHATVTVTEPDPNTQELCTYDHLRDSTSRGTPYRLRPRARW